MHIRKLHASLVGNAIIQDNVAIQRISNSMLLTRFIEPLNN